MMRSMYTAISGLRTHQFKMDVIGNNIANVNTVGFKKSKVSFQEVFNQTTAGASAPQGGRGGTNPQQVGLGVNVGSVKVVHEQGAPQRTDDPLDFFISGDGYFVVSGDSSFNNKSYTRAGNFDLDRDGTLVTAEGLKVLGYTVNEDGTLNDTLSDIKIEKSETVAPTATENMKLKGNLDSRINIYKTDKDGKYVDEDDEILADQVDPGGRVLVEEDKRSFNTDTIIYDSLGNPYTVNLKITKGPIGTDTTVEENTWNVSLNNIKDSNGNYVTGASLNGAKIEFNPDGGIKSLGPIELKDLPNVNGGNFENPIKIDVSGLTQYGNDTTAKAYKEDGNTSGNIESFSISPKGEVVAVYTNGESKVLAQVALAKFDNPSGLSKEGSNLYKDTRNSGEPQFGKAASAGYGQMIGGAVEMSNVDLSNEFTEMITTQRGFQANSRVITTSDEILQELVNLKR